MVGTHECDAPTKMSRRGLLVTGALAMSVGAVGCVAGAAPEPSNPATPSSQPQPTEATVRFQINGSTFRPAIELVKGSNARVEWLDDKGKTVATGRTPTITFASPGVRTITMVTSYPDVATVNLGFNTFDDAGRFNIGSSFNKAAEAVTGVEGLPQLSNLRRFLAAGTPLEGTLDLTGLSRLEFVECYEAPIAAIKLDGCSSLMRLCLERSAITRLDLNPVAATLRDLRAANQLGGSLEFVALTQPLRQLYHFCVRDQAVTGHPSSQELPACEELWNWNTNQSGQLPTPQRAVSVMSRSNHYTSADFAGRWTSGAGELDLESNQLTNLDLTGCRALHSIRLRWNALPAPVVDELLAEVSSWGTKGTNLLLGGNASPSAKGLPHVAALRGLGWEVEVSQG